MNGLGKPVWLRPMVEDQPPALCVGDDELTFTVGEAILWVDKLQDFIKHMARKAESDGRG